MTAPVIRAAAAGDRKGLDDLYGAAFEEPYPAPVMNLLLQALSAWCLVAEVPADRGLALAGFAIARLVVGECEILTLGVAPGHRRQGVGRALVRAIRAEASRAQATAMFLEVGEDNEAARELYLEAEFEVVGRCPDYYRRADRSRIAALIMRSAV